MRLFNGVSRRFMALNYTMRAAIVSALITAILSVAGGWAVHGFTKEPRTETVRMKVGIKPAHFHLPPLSKLSKEQLDRFQEMEYLISIEIPNETGTPLLTPVVTIPREGIAEVMDADSHSVVIDYKKRIDLVVIPAMTTYKIHMWHKLPLEPGETVALTSMNGPKLEFPWGPQIIWWRVIVTSALPFLGLALLAHTVWGWIKPFRGKRNQQSSPRTTSPSASATVVQSSS